MEECDLNKTKEITEAGLFAALLVVIITGVFYIPLLGGIMMLFVPVPIVVLSMRVKPLYVTASTAVAILLSSMLVTLPSAVSIGAFAFCIGLPVGLGFKRKMDGLTIFFIGTVGAAVGFFITLELIELVSGLSFIGMMEQSTPAVVDTYTQMFAAVEELGVSNTLSQEEIKKVLDDGIFAFKLLLPSLIIMSSMMYAIINMLMSIQIFKRIKIDYKPLGKFESFRYPKHVAYGAMGMMLLAFILGTLEYIDSQLITANFLYLFQMIFAIEGASLIYYFIKKRSGKGMAVVVILLVFVMGLAQLLAYLGFFDVMMDLRRLDQMKQNKD